MFYIDWLYIILVLPPMIFAMWASFKVNSTFKKYSVIPTVRGITGADARGKNPKKGGKGRLRLGRCKRCA